MNALQVLELVAVAVAEIAKLAADGISHGEALKRVRRIGEDARKIDADVDAAARGHRP